MNATLATLLAAVASAAVTVAAEAAPAPGINAQGSAIVVQDQASLRAAPRDGAQQQASLWQGEVLEVRGERLDYLQVWDHKRERGGFIRASDVRRVAMTEAEGPALLAVMRFVQDTPGAEALGIGLTAAYLQAAPAKALAGMQGAQAFDAVVDLRQRGKYQHRRLHALFAQGADHRQPIHPGKHPVDNEDVIAAVAGERVAFKAVRREVDRMASFAQRF